VGAIDAAALGPFKKWARGHGRENEKTLLYFGCDFSGWYNFGKIIKIVATRCHILKLKCTKFDFGGGSAPDAAGGSLQRSPNLLPGYKGPTSKGTEGRGGEEGKKGVRWGELRGMGSTSWPDL